MSRRSAVGLVVLAAVVAAATVVPLTQRGGGTRDLSKARYADSVNAVYRRLEARIHGAAPGRSSAEMSHALRAVKSALDRAGADLARLHPPPDAERDQRMLVESTRDYARQIDLVRASVDLGNPAVIASHLREVTAPAAIRAALRDLAAKGYRVSPTLVALP